MWDGAKEDQFSHQEEDLMSLSYLIDVSGQVERTKEEKRRMDSSFFFHKLWAWLKEENSSSSFVRCYRCVGAGWKKKRKKKD